ncbi:hypothetical protein PHSC3_000797 [Chlamydiales bacterium STE3]|nr:hypothetical protein PHSC3_000797 [Chlamydiales bacterium STE3]
MPYTIVLTPPVDQRAKYVEASQQLYSAHHPSYLLNGEGTSSPHITIVQFDCESSDLANRVWLEFCSRVKEENFAPFSPAFTEVIYKEGAGPYEGTTWVEISVNKEDPSSPLMAVHHIAVEILKSYDLKIHNAIQESFRPHLTLARIEMPKTLKACPSSLYENPGKFNLEFGQSDEKWQYAKRLGVFV